MPMVAMKSVLLVPTMSVEDDAFEPSTLASHGLLTITAFTIGDGGVTATSSTSATPADMAPALSGAGGAARDVDTSALDFGYKSK